MQYERNDIHDVVNFVFVGMIDINPVHGTPPVRIELFGDEVNYKSF